MFNASPIYEAVRHASRADVLDDVDIAALPDPIEDMQRGLLEHAIGRPDADRDARLSIVWTVKSLS